MNLKENKMEFIKSKIGNPSGLRVKTGTQECGWCKSKKDIIQFERTTKRKGLPIVEIAFICKPCAEKEDLIKDSKEVGNNES